VVERAVGAVTPVGVFDNSFARDLPELCEPWTARHATSPRLLVLNDELARRLGGSPEVLRSVPGVEMLVGNLVPDGAEPVAQAYAGHQFGGYSPRLGDGRALLLGEIIGNDDARHDLQLKGSGRTPFARGGDGLAAIGPMLREYLMCEAMHALGIPTTRALAVVATGDDVRRDALVPGAVLARVAASHLRVGTFQYAASIDQPGLLERLVDHSIARHHPRAGAAENPAAAFFVEVMDAQAELIASWMLVGFVHGVMNTDNMTISGETIDYGPCAFMDGYDVGTVFSSIDHGGRYAYGNQPQIAQWNLARLAETLLPLFDTDLDASIEQATALLHTFPDRYRRAWLEGMRAKLGLSAAPDASSDADGALFDDLLAMLQDQHVDYTSFIRSLSAHVRGDSAPTRAAVTETDALDAWIARWDERRCAGSPNADDLADAMDRTNPVYVPRNHLVEEALDAATDGDLQPFERLVKVLADPFTERPGFERYAQPAPPEFGRHRTFCGT
jgi:uncharacterized protein YdiU (UPF0061 family)